MIIQCSAKSEELFEEHHDTGEVKPSDVHKERTDSLDVVAIANDYVKDSQYRLRVFGTFH